MAGRASSAAPSLKAATVPARIPEAPLAPRTGFRRVVRARGSRSIVTGTRLPPIGLPVPDSAPQPSSASQPSAGGLQPPSASCSLEGSDSSTALFEATVALSPRSLRAQHVAIQKDNQRLRREVAALRARSCGPDEGRSAVPFSFVFLYASPLCYMVDKTHKRLLPCLDAESETEGIQRALGSLHPVEAEVASALSLRRAAQRPGAWLHLCAHTAEVAPGQRCAMFEDQGIQPMAMKFTPEELEALLPADGKASGSFAFLAMCRSSAYREAFKRAGFRHIIDCETEVHDKHAAKFAHDLYGALADGQFLSSAFQIALTCAKARGDCAVYHLEGDGRLQLPAPSARPPVPLPSAEPLPGELPRSAEDFVGRVPQMCEVLMAMQNRLVVVLHATASNGRTATLQQIGQYASRRGRHFAGRCAFHPAKAPPGGLLIVDDAEEVLAAGRRHELIRHLQSHKGSRLLMACREPCYDTFLDCGIKPYNVPLPPLQDLEATELFLRSTHRPLTAADLSPHSVRAGDESPCRIMPKAEAQRTLRNGIGVFAGEPGKVRKAGVSVRPGSPPLDLPRLVT